MWSAINASKSLEIFMNTNPILLVIILFTSLSTSPLIANAFDSESLIRNTEITGYVEFEATSSDDYAGVNSNDIALATIELSIRSEFTKRISSNFLLLREDDTSAEVDEAFVSVRIKNPITLTIGRLYLPFGNYETNMISDSLPLELSEARDTAIQLEYEQDAIKASFYLFDGDVLENNTSSTIDNMGFNVAYYTKPFTIGLSYINNLNDSNLITDSISPSQSVVSYTPGLSVYATTTFDKVSVFFEYISALDEFNTADLSFRSSEAKLTATNLEVGYNIDNSIFAAAIQSSTKAVNLGLPKTRLLLSYTVKMQQERSITNDYSLAFELASNTDYSVADGGTGNKAPTLTIQLGITF